MGANRQMRRRQEREQVRDWRRKGTLDQVLAIRKNGITTKDLDKAYKDGYDEGFMSA